MTEENYKEIEDLIVRKKQTCMEMAIKELDNGSFNKALEWDQANKVLSDLLSSAHLQLVLDKCRYV